MFFGIFLGNDWFSRDKNYTEEEDARVARWARYSKKPQPYLLLVILHSF